MSRSVYQTIKGVFGGKSKSEIDEMIANDDQDVQALRKKAQYKQAARDARNVEKSRQEGNDDMKETDSANNSR